MDTFEEEEEEGMSEDAWVFCFAAQAARSPENIKQLLEFTLRKGPFRLRDSTM